MSHRCVVKIWKKNHGFAEADDGSIVYISKDDIGGMQLKVGYDVYCDLVQVEGHGGRVKGTNVSGEAIVPLEDNPTPEELKAHRAEWERFKQEKIAVDGAEPPKRAKASKSAPKGGKGGKSGGKGGKSGGKGGKGAKGVQAANFQGRMAGAPRGGIAARGVAGGEERRVDPADGRAYTRQDFIAQYGGLREWNTAARQASAGRGQSTEKRVDPADGRAYTRQDFIAQYGGVREWNAAAPRQQQPARAPAGRGKGVSEKRVDPADGRAYTKADFMACYQSLDQWNRAQPYSTSMGRGRGRR